MKTACLQDFKQLYLWQQLEHDNAIKHIGDNTCRHDHAPECTNMVDGVNTIATGNMSDNSDMSN